MPSISHAAAAIDVAVLARHCYDSTLQVFQLIARHLLGKALCSSLNM